jgi:small redox-active disulfide protein 2
MTTGRTMPEYDLTKIRINNRLVGIIGLKPIIEQIAQADAEVSDQEIQSELTRRLSQKNYIPDHAREAYGKAFLREFNKFLGRAYEDDGSEGLEIKILGPGCARCDQLEREVMEVTAEMKLLAAVEHVRDIKEIGRYGVMGTPALIINGKVVSVGAVPNRVKIKAWLRAFV